MSKLMRALVVRAPGDYGIEQVERPVPEAGGLLLKVKACGLCGSDLRTLRSGHHHVKLPWTIGHEICGEVVETGVEYKDKYIVGDILAVGPLAYCGRCDYCMSGRFELCENQAEIGQKWPGGLAEYVALPADCLRLGNVNKISAGTRAEYAAVAEPISSCINAQEKAEITLGDSVVIIGSGPIGCIHVSLAKIRGAFSVILIDISDSRLKLAKPFGADHLINATETDPVKKVMEITGDRGATVVIAATPAPIAAVQAVEMAAKGGRVLQFGGMPKGDSKPGVDMNLIHYKGLSVIGTTTFSPQHNRTALKMIESGRFPVGKLVSHIFPLNDFEKGAAMALKGEVLKGVFIP